MFSKEELELIRDNLSWNDCYDVNLKLIELDRKLEEMIKDYCDHKNQMFVSDADYVIVCRDCDKTISYT